MTATKSLLINTDGNRTASRLAFIETDEQQRLVADFMLIARYDLMGYSEITKQTQ